MKKAVALLALILASTVSYADFKLNFENVGDPNDISGLNKVKGEVSIEDTGESKVLRLGSKRAIFKTATNFKLVEDFDFSLDWRTSAPGLAGFIFALTDFNHNKQFLRFTLEQSKVSAGTFSSKKFKNRRLFKPKANIWYRFDVKVLKGRYTVKITERGKDNSEDGEVAYSSIEKKKRLKVNTKVKPHILMFQSWNKASGPFYEYDNISIKKK